MKKKQIEKLTWTDYISLISTLQEKILWNKESFNQIVAINRGGNIIGTVLSHKNNIPLTVLNYRFDKVPNYNKILIVDDISDSGETLGIVLSRLSKETKYKIATLHLKKESKVKSDYFSKYTNKWIQYPYEIGDK